MIAPDFDICEAIEIAASAANGRQNDERARDFACVSKSRMFTARCIIGRFLELAPEDITAHELRELLDDRMPALFMEAN